MYGAETWTMKKSDENKLDVFERKVLRRILGPVREQDGSYRLRYNDECQKELGESTISKQVKLKQLQWAAHVQRMSAENPTKKIYEYAPEGRRKRGRPNLRWVDNVDQTAEKLGRRNWRMLTNDRDAWRNVLREAKIQLGSRSH